jgi:putative acetyltransferase
MEFTIRKSTVDDAKYIKEWLMQPGVLQWFPMSDEKEIDDSAKVWVSYSALESCFIAEINGEAVGSVLLNISQFEKIKHQCLISIIVSEKYRGQGIGRKLLEYIERVAKEKFHIQLLHLEVYENNPARRLYERVGYEVYGAHPKFIKEQNGYKSKILMQKWLT